MLNFPWLSVTDNFTTEESLTLSKETVVLSTPFPSWSFTIPVIVCAETAEHSITALKKNVNSFLIMFSSFLIRDNKDTCVSQNCKAIADQWCKNWHERRQFFGEMRKKTSVTAFCKCLLLIFAV